MTGTELQIIALAQPLAAGQLTVIEFSDTATGFSAATQYTFTSGASVSTRTVQQNPARVNVRLCAVTGRSQSVKADRLYLYPPGNPDVTSVSASSGKAAGRTKVTIGGSNLGCAIGVFSGKVKATSFTQGAGLLDCGSVTTLTAISLRGKASAKVPLSVETVESFFTRAGTPPRQEPSPISS